MEYFSASTCNATTTTGCSSTPLCVTVGNDPGALAVDGGAGDLYVANAGGGGTISVISLSNQALATTISTDSTNQTVQMDGTPWCSRSAYRLTVRRSSPFSTA